MAILFDLTHQLAGLLQARLDGTATGGSTTTIADTVERTEDDDYWNGGTAWITYDAGGAGAAPQSELSLISDFANTGGIVTLRSTLTAAVASGDKYSVATKRYPLELLTQKINEELGVIEKTDKTTVVFAADQTEYSLPTDVWDLRQVWVQAVNDTNDNHWEQIFDWKVEKTATGTADLLVLRRQFTAAYVAKLVYLASHSVLRASSDKLDESLLVKKVIHNAAVRCLLWRKAKVGDSDMTINEMLNYYQALADKINQEFPQQLPKKSAKLIRASW